MTPLAGVVQGRDCLTCGVTSLRLLLVLTLTLVCPYRDTEQISRYFTLVVAVVGMGTLS